MRGLLALATVVLVVYALVDCLRSPGPEVRGLPKALWVVIILLLPVVGALAWLVAGRGHGPASAGRPRPAGPVAPDDDPDFLWRLEQERRRSRDDERRGSGDGPGGAAGPEPA